MRPSEAAPTPIRARTAEREICGRPVSAETRSLLGETVLRDVTPRDSWRASKAFREHIAVEMAKRCLIESIKRAGGVIK